MEMKSGLKENIIRLMVHIGYFISLFIVGLILTYIVTWAALRIMPNRDLNEIITWGGILVFMTISLIDTAFVFSGRVSPAIILLVLPFALILVIFYTIKHAFEKMPVKVMLESMKDIFKAELVVDSNDNAINSIANGLCKKYH